MLHAMAARCARPAPTSAWASTATATAAASSTTRATKSSPTRSASCWRETCRSFIQDATFVVDVKSTGLFATDPVLKAQGVKADYWKTGHSHIKRRVSDLKALAGFEKSGHFFFNAPVGRGYDDGFSPRSQCSTCSTAIPTSRMADLYARSAENLGFADDVAALRRRDEIWRRRQGDARFEAMQARARRSPGQNIPDLVTVNGVRVTVEDGTWGLVRASSNKPELVVVVESPVSEARMREMFKAVDAVLRENPEVGAYNQTI